MTNPKWHLRNSILTDGKGCFFKPISLVGKLPLMTSFSWFKRNSAWGIFLLRLFMGLRLIYGVIDNVTRWETMLDFRDFLQQSGFPFPLVCAIVSVYAQLFAGIAILFGWMTRWAAILMIINFLMALIMVHRNDPVEGMTPPLAILFCCILLLFQGPGKISIDKN
jgi:putative oxidoreductase